MQNTDNIPNQSPGWSIVIPAYNRPQRLQACLQSLADLDTPRGGFEVVVVDDGSSPPLQKDLSIPEGLDARIIRQDNGGPASARNHAVRAARGRWIAFTDDDCQPHPGWLRNFDRSMDKHKQHIVGGLTLNALARCAPAAASQMLIDYLHAYFNEQAGGPTFFPSNNFCIARETYEALGGFDESFPLAAAEDRDFCDRAVASGVMLSYDPEAVIDHRHAMSLRGFWRQHFHYGRGAWAFHVARAGRSHEPIQIEPMRFYFGLILFPLRRLGVLRGLSHSLLMVVSQVANTAGYARERFGTKRR